MGDFFSDKFIPWFEGVLPALIRIALILLLAALLGWLVPKLVGRIWGKAHADEAARHYMLSVVKWLIWIVAIIICLELLGFPIASLLTVIAAVGAAVALAIKDSLANVASGIVLLFTKPFKAGDFIEVGSVSGTIKRIEVMHTYVDTISNTLAAIPNTTMMSATILNYTAHETRRQDMFFSIGYDDDILKAKNVLLKVAADNDMVLNSPEAPLVVVREYGASAVGLMLRFWCLSGNYFPVQFALNEQVKLAFDENGITIPYQHVNMIVENNLMEVTK